MWTNMDLGVMTAVKRGITCNTLWNITQQHDLDFDGEYDTTKKKNQILTRPLQKSNVTYPMYISLLPRLAIHGIQ